jgi:hypothetical protein
LRNYFHPTIKDPGSEFPRAIEAAKYKRIFWQACMVAEKDDLLRPFC